MKRIAKERRNLKSNAYVVGSHMRTKKLARKVDSKSKGLASAAAKLLFANQPAEATSDDKTQEIWEDLNGEETFEFNADFYHRSENFEVNFKLVQEELVRGYLRFKGRSLARQACITCSSEHNLWCCVDCNEWYCNDCFDNSNRKI